MSMTSIENSNGRSINRIASISRSSIGATLCLAAIKIDFVYRYSDVVCKLLDGLLPLESHHVQLTSQLYVNWSCRWVDVFLELEVDIVWVHILFSCACNCDSAKLWVDRIQHHVCYQIEEMDLFVPIQFWWVRYVQRKYKFPGLQCESNHAQWDNPLIEVVFHKPRQGGVKLLWRCHSRLLTWKWMAL